MQVSKTYTINKYRWWNHTHAGRLINFSNYSLSHSERESHILRSVCCVSSAEGVNCSGPINTELHHVTLTSGNEWIWCSSHPSRDFGSHYMIPTTLFLFFLNFPKGSFSCFSLDSKMKRHRGQKQRSNWHRQHVTYMRDKLVLKTKKKLEVIYYCSRINTLMSSKPRLR